MLRPRVLAFALTLLAYGAGSLGAAPVEAKASGEKVAGKKRRAKSPAKTPRKDSAKGSGKGAAKGPPKRATEDPARPTTKKTAAASPKRDGQARRPRKGDRKSRTTMRTPEPERVPRAAPLAILSRAITCPTDMVAVAGRVCVDRYETSLVDVASGEAWSPFYTPDLSRVQAVTSFYEALLERTPPGSLSARFRLPEAPSFDVKPRAINLPGVIPQGYLTADQAEGSCKAAGKRLCTEAEWLTACRGEAQRDFPYGETYVHGVCNVYRESHPTALLHGNAARYHDDPRNGLVEVAGRALAQPTGGEARCASRWGDDAVFDMVGNLDEWVADPRGVFVGGFYSRGTRSGCFARVSNHPRTYSDYSIGTRCCQDPALDG